MFKPVDFFLVFFWHGTATNLLDAVYWQSAGPDSGTNPKYALVKGFYNHVVCAAIDSASLCLLVFVLIKIACFSLVCFVCAKVGYFWKL